jgi:PKD repeat protein
LSKIGYGTFDVKVKLTVTRCGCSTSTEQTITVKELPNADLTATPANWTQCNSSNPSFPLSVFPVINDPLKNATYKIAWGDGTYTPPVGVNNFPYSAAIPHTYSTYNKWTLTHTVTSATNGCTNVKTYPVFNGSNPVPVLSCPATILPACIPPPVSLVIPYDPNYTDNSPGTICEFTYFDNDPAHYPKTQTTLVEELPAVFTVDYETSSCGYTVSSPSPFAGSTNIFAIRCKVTNQCVTAGIAPPMIHDCYTGTYGGKPVPDFQFKSSTGQVITSGCLYDDITLNSTTAPTNSGTVLCDNNATRTYHWTITPNTYTPISGWDNTVSPVVKFTANGIYDVTLEVSNACPGAAASITRQICIDNLSPVAAFTVPADPLNPSNCSPFTFTPDITGSSAADGCGVVNYQWSVTYAGGTCPNSGGAPTWVTGNATSAAPTIKLIDPGNYTITLMVSNSCGTSVPSTQNVTVKGKPVVTITPPGSPPNYGPFCEGGTFHFCMNIQDCYGTVNPSSKSWRLNGVSAGTGDCVDLTGLAAGSYSLTAEAENECGIGVSAPFIFTVSPVPIPTINGPGIVNQGAVACYITEPGMVFYNWTIQGGGSFSGGMLTNTCCVNWGGVGLGQVCVSYAGGLNNCNANTPTCMNVTINPCPTVQTVTLTRHGTNPTVVGNDFCMGDPGIDVCLTASESGIVYKLFDSFGTQWGTNLVGPSGGGSICFTPPVNVPGFFYITATNTSSLCTINFPSFQIFSISPPAIVAITPQGPECEDLPQGVPLGLSMWQTGIDYEWNFNGDSWNSSGGPPILTQAIATGTYCARAVDPFTQCVSNTLNCVDIMPQPMAINAIAPQGVMPVCQNIFLPVSQSGFEYKLINRTIGSVITWSPATGSSHWFNNICEPGLYEIEARNINTPPYCTRVMDWSLFLYECATPFVVNPIGSQCQGVHVYLSNSEIDVVYELKETNSGTVKQNILSTNGGPLDFGVLDYTYPEGIYKIFAKQSVFPGSGDTCITEMFGQIDLCEKPLPKVISPSGNVCNVASITLFNSDPGVTYHLMHWGNDPVQSLTGNGAMLIFNSINNNPPFNQPFFPNGIYHIKAVKSCTGVQCETTFESINVEPGPQINAGADITTCAGPSNTIYINDATAIYYSSVLWTDLSGLGTFTPNNVLNPIYTSGSIPGTRVLRMQVAGLPCFETTVFDEKIINVLPTPELTSTLNPPPICTGQTFNYTPTSLTTGTIFTWSRASLPGILEPSTSGSGNISEVLTN